MVICESGLELELSSPPEVKNQSRRIFLVHGRAEEPKQNVAEFLRTLGLDVIILHEQANQGLTIIEKFEKHSAVGFPVFLLTPHDFVVPAGHPEKMPHRARPNSIIESTYPISHSDLTHTSS